MLPFKTINLFLTIFLAVTCVISSSCKKDKAGTGSETSAYSSKSHNVGSDCMSCHNTGGSNQFWWIVAGTVFKPDSVSLNPGCTVYLFSGPNGTDNLILALPVDKTSNFYTTRPVSFGMGLYPEVKSASGEIRYMQSSITSGNCNKCHTKTNPIIVN